MHQARDCPPDGRREEVQDPRAHGETSPMARRIVLCAGRWLCRIGPLAASPRRWGSSRSPPSTAWRGTPCRRGIRPLHSARPALCTMRLAGGAARLPATPTAYKCRY